MNKTNNSKTGRFNSTVLNHVSGPALQNQRISLSSTAPVSRTNGVYKNDVFITPKKAAMRATTGGNSMQREFNSESVAASVDVHEIERNAQQIDIEKAMKLYFGPTFDTTDRSLVEASEDNRFDPEGFESEDPLTKHMFYTDPYITCRNCNNLSFVDVVTIRRMLSLPRAVAEELKLPPEILPPCPVCGKADSFLVGSHDFSAEIAERRMLEEEIIKRHTVACTIIQRSYRKYLLRMYGSALSDAFLADKFLKHKAAVKINSIARGRLARRVRITEEHLVTIKKSHPLLIRHALRSTVGGPKVFWYKRQVELDLLYDNYLELVGKTGYVPVRLVVERNIAELARRIVERKNLLIVLIQRRWRGVMTRRMVMYFRTELIRLFQFNVAQALMIQATYRGHRARLLIPKIVAERRRSEIMQSYLQRGKDQLLVERRDKLLEQSHLSYMKERAEEKTVRYCSMIPTPSEYGMRKMAAFWDSQFVGQQLTKDTTALLQTERDISLVRQDGVDRQTARKQFIMQRIALRGPAGFGLRSVAMEQPPYCFFVEQDVDVLAAADPAEAAYVKDIAGVGKYGKMKLIEQQQQQQQLQLQLHQRMPTTSRLTADTNILADVSAGAGTTARTGNNSVAMMVVSSIAPAYDILSRAEASRCRAMRFYFESELRQLAAATVVRIKKEFKKDHSLRSWFQEFNMQRLRPRLMMHSHSSHINGSAGDVLLIGSGNQHEQHKQKQKQRVKSLKEVRFDRALRKQQEATATHKDEALSKIVEPPQEQILVTSTALTAENITDHKEKSDSEAISTAVDQIIPVGEAVISSGKIPVADNKRVRKAHFADDVIYHNQQESAASSIVDKAAELVVKEGDDSSSVGEGSKNFTVDGQFCQSETSIDAATVVYMQTDNTAMVAANSAILDFEEEKQMELIELAPNYIVHDDLSNILGHTFRPEIHPGYAATATKVLLASEDAMDPAADGEDVFVAAEAARTRMDKSSDRNQIRGDKDPAVKIPKIKKGDFKYPAHVHFNAMEWLYADDEDDVA